jgi:hypothetical protein
MESQELAAEVSGHISQNFNITMTNGAYSSEFGYSNMMSDGTHEQSAYEMGGLNIMNRRFPPNGGGFIPHNFQTMPNPLLWSVHERSLSLGDYKPQQRDLGAVSQGILDFKPSVSDTNDDLKGLDSTFTGDTKPVTTNSHFGDYNFAYAYHSPVPYMMNNNFGDFGIGLPTSPDMNWGTHNYLGSGMMNNTANGLDGQSLNNPTAQSMSNKIVGSVNSTMGTSFNNFMNDNNAMQNFDTVMGDNFYNMAGGALPYNFLNRPWQETFSSAARGNLNDSMLNSGMDYNFSNSVGLAFGNNPGYSVTDDNVNASLGGTSSKTMEHTLDYTAINHMSKGTDFSFHGCISSVEDNSISTVNTEGIKGANVGSIGTTNRAPENSRDSDVGCDNDSDKIKYDHEEAYTKSKTMGDNIDNMNDPFIDKPGDNFGNFPGNSLSHSFANIMNPNAPRSKMDRFVSPDSNTPSGSEAEAMVRDMARSANDSRHSGVKGGMIGSLTFSSEHRDRLLKSAMNPTRNRSKSKSAPNDNFYNM